MKNHLILSLLLLASTCLAESTIPASKTNRICLAWAGNDAGEASIGAGMFAARAPTNWTLVYALSDSLSNGAICWNWTNNFFDKAAVDRCLASNVTLVLLFSISQGWTLPWPAPFQGNPYVETTWAGTRYAAGKGLNVLTPHYNNDHIFVDQIGPKNPSCVIEVGGGHDDTVATTQSYGPQLEFVDGVWSYDTAESWAYTATSARFAHIMNAHTNWNSFDVRAAARGACFNYPVWTNNLGYGFPEVTNRVGDTTGWGNNIPSSTDAQPPLEAWMVVTNNSMYFFWENYLQKDWTATVIRCNGSIMYEGPGTNITYARTYDWGGFGSNWWYDVTLNGIKLNQLSHNVHGTNYTFEFHSRVNGSLSQTTPYSSVVYIDPADD